MKVFQTIWLTVLSTGWHVSALLKGEDGEPGMSQAMFPKSLAGCKTGNFIAKGLNECAGIQGLQCDELGSCMGQLEGKSFHINCNHKHECVTHRWGGELVRKFMSVTKDDGSVHWNNGCAWICDHESSSALVRYKIQVHTTGWFWERFMGKGKKNDRNR